MHNLLSHDYHSKTFTSLSFYDSLNQFLLELRWIYLLSLSHFWYALSSSFSSSSVSRRSSISFKSSSIFSFFPSTNQIQKKRNGKPLQSNWVIVVCTWWLSGKAENILLKAVTYRPSTAQFLYHDLNPCFFLFQPDLTHSINICVTSYLSNGDNTSVFKNSLAFFLSFIINSGSCNFS